MFAARSRAVKRLKRTEVTDLIGYLYLVGVSHLKSSLTFCTMRVLYKFKFLISGNRGVICLSIEYKLMYFCT